MEPVTQSNRGGQHVPFIRRMQPHFPLIGAVVTIVFIGCVFYFRYLGDKPDARAVAIAEYQARPLPSGESPEVESGISGPLAEPLGWLDSQEPARLSEAAERLEMVSPADPSYRKAQYYLGHAFFRQGQYANAAEQFARVLSELRPGSRRQQECQYFLLLSQIAAGNAPRAYRPLLEQIMADPEHLYHSDVTELGKKLE